jgi:T5SS/PEP-CTERM-associated repeat protein/autotransporter-associated beta strand protein
MLVSGNLGGTNGLITSGSGTLTLTGSDDFGDGSVDTENGTLAIQSGGSVFDLTSYIGNNAGSSGLVTVTGSNSTWTGDGDFYVGNSGTGTLLITSGGTVYNDNAVSNIGATIGENAGSSGMVTVTGSNSAWIDYGDLYVGDSGSGTLLITSGGTVYNFYNNFGATIGENAGSSGLVTVTGTNSTWIDYGGLYVGDSGSGTLLITSGGRVHNTGFGATIGENAGSSGLVTVTGTSSSWADYGDLYVGDSGSGTLLIENGGTVYNFVTDFGATILGATIGENAGSSGLVSVTNSAWIDFGDLFVGDSGSGTLVISNGGYVSNSVYNIGGVIGNGAGSSGMVTVTGSNSTWIAYGDLFVGDSGSGTLVISNGGYVSNGVYFNLIGGVIGNAAGSSGLVRVSGSGSAWIDDGDLYAGNSGAGKLVITRGGFVLDYNGYVGFNPGSSGMVTVSGTGSTWTNFGDVYVGGNTTGAGGAGTLSITNGGLVDAYQTTVWTSGTLAFGENSTLESPLSVNGGTVTLVDGQVQTVTLTNQVTIGAGSKLNFDVGNGSDQIALSEAGLLTVTGPVTVNLTGISGQVTAGTDVIIGADTSGYLSLGNIYNSGNFTYSLLYTPLSEDVIVAPATALTTAYWKGGVSNVWSILAGGTATNWTTDQAGTNDPHLTPSATTDVIFSANTPANQGNTVLGTDMTIKSLTVSDTNALVISGSDPNSMRGTDTLTISGSTGATGVTVSAGAGLVTIGANLYLTGSSQTVAVSNPAGLLVSGSLGGTGGLIKSGTGTLVLTGDDAFAGATTIIGGMVIVSGSLTRTMSATVAAGAAQEVDGMLNLSATSTVSGALSGAGSVGAVTVKGGGYLSPGLRSPVSQALENALQISAEDGSLGQGPADSSDQEADSTALATGTLTASGNVTFNEGSNFSIRLGVASTEDNDQLSIVNGGTVALNGANLQLTLGSFMQDAAIGAMYVIISGGAADTGARFDNTFEQGSSITEPGGYSFDILYAANADGRDIGSGSDVVLELIAVPEPGTWAMIAWGLTMLIAMRKVRGRRCGAPAEFNPRGRPPVRN